MLGSQVYELCAAAKDVGVKRVVLLPVVTNCDAVKENPKEICGEVKGKLKVKCNLVDVYPTAWLDSGHGRARVFARKFDEIRCRQLRSPALLEIGRDFIEEPLRRFLQMQEKQDVATASALARRFVWVAARHRGLRIRRRDGKTLMLTWKDTDSVIQQLKDWKRENEHGNRASGASDVWHSDPMRDHHQNFQEKARMAALERAGLLEICMEKSQSRRRRRKSTVASRRLLGHRASTCLVATETQGPSEESGDTSCSFDLVNDST